VAAPSSYPVAKDETFDAALVVGLLSRSRADAIKKKFPRRLPFSFRGGPLSLPFFTPQIFLHAFATGTKV